MKAPRRKRYQSQIYPRHPKEKSINATFNEGTLKKKKDQCDIYSRHSREKVSAPHLTKAHWRKRINAIFNQGTLD